MTRVWMPAIPLKFIERGGKKILQQAWQRHAFNPDKGWIPVEGHEWRDVPFEDDFNIPVSHWVQGEV